MNTKIGKLFIVTSGSYSDYQIVGTFRVLREDVMEGVKVFRATFRALLSAGKTIVANYSTQYPQREWRPGVTPIGTKTRIYTESIEDYKVRIKFYFEDLAKEKETHIVEWELAYSITALLGYLSKEGYIEDADVPEIHEENFERDLEEQLK